MATTQENAKVELFDHQADAGDHYLSASSGTGFKSWAFTLDHKRISIMYLIGLSIALLLGGVFALLLRTELLTGDGLFGWTNDTYNQMFTLHGAVMVFLFLIPGIPAGMGNFVLPLMLGAKDVAFPRINLLSFYLWATGAIFFFATLALGGLDTGWTFYTPYSIESSTSVITATFGAFVLGFSSIFTGLNFIVTVHKMRAKGQGWFQMPLFVWSVYATGIIQILATPVLGITLLLLMAERIMHIGIFDPSMGGDPVLFQHFFWFYSHPAVYIMVLPAMGVASELFTTFARKHMFGYSFIAMSSLAIAFLGFIVWGHHMFTSGQTPIASTVFSFITFSVAIPSAIKVFNWLATLYKGSISLESPMVYALSFMGLFLIGGLTGLFCATTSVDIHLHDTYFIVAHFHYVMVGGTLVAFLGALHYWWPKISGRMYSEFWGVTSGVLVFIGFNVTFFPQFVMGSRGMPRRYHHYINEAYQSFHVISTIGSYILGVALVMVLVNLLYSLKRGRKAPANPWGATTLEWKTQSPPIQHNFHEEPEVPEIYEYANNVLDPKVGGYVDRRIVKGG